MSNKLYQDIPNGSPPRYWGLLANVMCSGLLREANRNKFDMNVYLALKFKCNVR